MNKFLEEMHATPAKISAAIAGGGTEIIGEILKRGGSGGTLLYFHAPYHPYSTDKYLGQQPEAGYCHRSTANLLAAKAYHDAIDWKVATKSTDPIAGIGATSSLAKIKSERSGRIHKILISLHTETKAVHYDIVFPQWLPREVEEKINAFLLFVVMGEACNIFDLTGLETVKSVVEKYSEKYEYDGITNQNIDFNIPIQRIYIEPEPFIFDLISGKAKACYCPASNVPQPKLVLPTSMNPLHEAHVNMAKIASEMEGQNCCFELSIVNADKPHISYFDIFERTKLFFDNKDMKCVLTNAPTFVEKAKLFGPNAVFAVGEDTARRICDPKFYGSVENMNLALRTMNRLNTRFICFARKYDNEIKEVNSKYPADFLSMCSIVSKDIYYSDISSTQIRKNNRG